jgi:hypothetical protein
MASRFCRWPKAVLRSALRQQILQEQLRQLQQQRERYLSLLVTHGTISRLIA